MRGFMKRLFILILVLFLLVSCNGRLNLLSYQDGDLCAICKVNGEYTVQIEKLGEERILSILEPSELSSVSFIINKEECFGVYGDTRIPLERDSLQGIVALCSIFDLSSDAISSTSVSENDATVSFTLGGVRFDITYGEDNLPKHVQIHAEDFSHEVEILDLKHVRVENH